MPQFHMPIGSTEGGRRFQALSEFAQGYVEAMFFTIDEELEGFSFEDLSQDTLRAIVKDCRAFRYGLPKDGQGRTALDLSIDYAPGSYDNRRAGNDFWFTRNRHGVGFWDRGLGAVGDELTEAAHAFGECDLYEGDDGRLYLS